MFCLRRTSTSRSPSRRAVRRRLPLQPYLLLALLGVALGVWAYGPSGSLPQGVLADPPAPPAALPPTQPAPAAAEASPLDEPLRLVGVAAQTYDRIKDYSCTMIKQERVGGKLGAENVIQMKLRKQPFSVYMKWVAPRNLSGQEVA